MKKNIEYQTWGKIHFDAVTCRNHFDLSSEEQKYFQAEILVKNFLPLEYISNIASFNIPLPSDIEIKNIMAGTTMCMIEKP